MGTNYYLETKYKDACSHCGRGPDVVRRHIGKSSGGWCFALHVYPEYGINDLADWHPLLMLGHIFDEYGETIPIDVMYHIITNRGFQNSPTPDECFLEDNYAELGPNGLARAKIDMRHCIGHGDGTWDCVIGDFS
jgi:hypothetical protein